jgi:signal transduction histidine kinase/ActR/RegA family two-component response regulator
LVRSRESQFRRALRTLICTLVISALVCVPATITASAAGTGTPPTVVRVGYFSNGDFMHKTNGVYAGYDVEYYYTVAGYANWKIQFVEYDSFNSALAALRSGDIDIMSGLAKTDERMSSYLVSSKKMCEAQISVQTRAGDDRFAVGDTDTMKNMTCGILRGSNITELYKSWCAENGLVPHIVGYDSLDERNSALIAGKVDSVAGGSTIEGAQKIAVFPSMDLYFMFNRSRSDLKAQLDRSMSILSLNQPSYATELFLKYFPPSRNSTPSFSAAEKKYLESHPVIKTAVLASDAPFSSKRADGTVVGILPDYYAHLSKLIGVRFECVPYATKDKAVAALHAGKVDLVGKFGNDVFEANSRQLIMSVPYLNMNMVAIMRAGTDSVKSYTVPQCNYETAAATLVSQGSSASIRSCDNSEHCFELLKSGKVDSVICTQPAATWLLNRNRATEYVVNAFGSSPWNVVCALPYGSDGNTLRSILNKAIISDNGYINQLITGETLDDSADLATVFDRMPVSLLATAVVVAAILLAIAAAAIIILIRRRKAVRQIAQRQAALTAEEEANRAKHAFFGAVSHDMRTPLNGIIGFADLALANDDPAVVRGYLTKIRKSGSILCGLVDDTLVMSRIENGKYRVNPVPVELPELLEEVLEPVRALAAGKKVELKENISLPGSMRVLADRIALQKILLNLLSNAVHFTPEGGTVSLGCRLEPSDGASPDTVITVSDTGVGISKEFLPHVFEPFAQADPSRLDSTSSGMGLAIVKRMVDAMGGTVAAESSDSSGTVFTVRLHLESTDSPTEATPAAQHDKSLLNGRRVLVCEDNALNSEIIAAVLANFGITPVCAKNGKDGVEAFEASDVGYFDAVLLDLRMPVMNGIEAAQKIRSCGRADAKRVPILAVSADAYAEDVEQCRRAGMNGHISKPIDPEKLYAVLAESIK